MQIILTAFQGKLKSQPMEVPENTTSKFKLALAQPVQFFSDGLIGENKDRPMMQSPITTFCEFEWTGKFVDDMRLYTLTNIEKF